MKIGADYFTQIQELRFLQAIANTSHDIKHLLLEYVLLSDDFTFYEQLQIIQFFRRYLIKKGQFNLLDKLYERLCSYALEKEPFMRIERERGKEFFKACRALCKFDKEKIHGKYRQILIRNMIQINERLTVNLLRNTADYYVNGVFKYYEKGSQMMIWSYKTEKGMGWFECSDDFYFAFFKNLDKRIIEKWSLNHFSIISPKSKQRNKKQRN